MRNFLKIILFLSLPLKSHGSTEMGDIPSSTAPPFSKRLATTTLRQSSSPLTLDTPSVKPTHSTCTNSHTDLNQQMNKEELNALKEALRTLQATIITLNAELEEKRQQKEQSERIILDKVSLCRQLQSQVNNLAKQKIENQKLKEESKRHTMREDAYRKLVRDKETDIQILHYQLRNTQREVIKMTKTCDKIEKLVKSQMQIIQENNKKIEALTERLEEQQRQYLREQERQRLKEQEEAADAVAQKRQKVCIGCVEGHTREAILEERLADTLEALEYLQRRLTAKATS